MKRFLLGGVASLSALCLSSPATAQKVLHVFEGTDANAYFGRAVAAAGDVDGDGFGDVIVGTPEADGNGVDAGRITVFSGQTGAVLYSYNGTSPGAFFGTAVGTVGDVNGDGFDEFLAGAPRSKWGGSEAGQVIVFSGQTGFALYVINGLPGERLGSAVDGGGDVDGDGFGDFVVGATRANPNGPGSGQATVYSGSTGAVLHTIDGDDVGDAMGTSVAIVPDVDGDGFDDVLAGASGDDDNGNSSGSIRLISGQTGAVLLSLAGANANDFFGLAVDGTGDVDLDGHGDFIVGAPGVTSHGTFSGNATVFSGLTGAPLWSVDGQEKGALLGSTVAGVGDLDGDGAADFLVGSPNEDVAGLKDVGTARLFSGSDGSVIFPLVGDKKQDHCGTSVAFAGDVNADGRGDIVIGADLDDGAKQNVGTARVIAGQGFIGTNYCGPAVLNVTGLPGVIQALGSEVAAANNLTLRVLQLPIKRYGLFLVSPKQAFFANPGGSLGNLCLGGPIARFLTQFYTSDLAGTISIDVDLNALPFSPPVVVQPGEVYNFTCWYRDFDVDTNFTDAISVTFQ